jgi:hypothetical protein
MPWTSDVKRKNKLAKGDFGANGHLSTSSPRSTSKTEPESHDTLKKNHFKPWLQIVNF